MTPPETPDCNRDAMASFAAPAGYAFQCKCGSTVFTRTSHVRGTWESIIEFTKDGRVKTEGCGDSVRSVRQSKTMRCDSCYRRVKVPDMDALA